MGLDMYLYAETYVSKYNYSDSFDKENGWSKSDNDEYTKVNSIGILGRLPTPEFGGITIAKCVGYWRKANAIHGWIVRNLANDVDECQQIPIEREDLIRLRDVCVNELFNRDKASPDEAPIEINDSQDVPSLITDLMKSQANKPKTNVLDKLALEPINGFFFGSTEKDEYYYSTLEYTIELINSLLAVDNDEVSYYYRASW